MMFEPDANVLEVRAAFEAEFPDDSYTKGVGWKQYKRWDYFWSLRADEDGDIPRSGDVIREVRRYLNAHLATRYQAGTGDWQEVGPAVVPANATGQPNGNGRLNCVAFHPTDPNTIYVGAPSGGFWETNDGGNTWTKRIDGLVRLGVSSIVVHPTDPDIIYIGTGDRDAADAPGYGVWKSTDGGNTWAPSNNGMGDLTVAEIIMHPDNPDILIAAAAYGMFRSTDGGANWAFYNTNHVAKDIAMHPTDPDILYAAGDLVWKSTDNGITWVDITQALPNSVGGSNRIALAVSADAPDVVYALAGRYDGLAGVYRSTDAGATWELRADSPNLLGYSSLGNDGASQSWYDLVLVADPSNADILFAGGVNIWKSSTGGSSWSLSGHWVGGGGADAIHADQHALEYSPHSGQLYVGNDGGICTSSNNGISYTDISGNLAIAQVYKIGIDPTDADRAVTGFQDNGTAMHLPDGTWRTILGGDGMECLIDPDDNSYVYSSLYYGDIRRSTTGGTNPGSLDVASESGGWVTPYKLAPDNSNTMYVGLQQVYRSSNVKSDYPVFTAIGGNYTGNTITDLAVSTVDPGVLYVSSGSQLQRSDNATSAYPTWTNLSGAVPGSGFIKDIEPHSTQAGTVYIARGNRIYKSTDYGASWVDYSGTLPGISLNTIVCDANSDVSALYVGMDVGVYYRDDLTGDWAMYSTGLPFVEVTELEIRHSPEDCGSRLYAGTYGSGMWKTALKDPGNKAPLACYRMSSTDVCAPAPVVYTFTDESSYTPTSRTWSISPATYELVDGTSVTDERIAVVFGKSGAYTVTLDVTNANGADSRTVTQLMASYNPIDLPLMQDYESAAEDAFFITNPDQSYTWEYTDIASSNGGQRSLMVSHYDYEVSGERDYYTLDNVDLSDAADNYLIFDVAYAPYSESRSDELRVEVSIDCGETWSTRYNKQGLTLSTTEGFVTDRFVPLEEQWRTEYIDLTAMQGKRISVRFVSTGRHGNQLYLDDMRWSAALPEVILQRFEGAYLPEEGNLLQWRMAAEAPGLAYELQRLHQTTGTWVTLYERSANNTYAYQYLDELPEFGENHYRLAMLLQDGTVKYSEVVIVTVDDIVESVTFYPNPTSGYVTIRTLTTRASQQMLQIVDVSGRLLRSEAVEVPSGIYEQPLDMSAYPTGVYYVQLGEVVTRVVVE